MEPIDLLPFNKTVQFDTTLTPEFLVRTGTLPDESLINCCLQACFKKFVGDSVDNKKKTISLTKEILKRKYLQSSIFVDFHASFVSSLKKLINDFYSYMSTKNNDDITDELKELLFLLFKENDASLIDLYVLICKIVPLQGGIDRIIKNCCKNWSCESNRDDLKNILLKEVKKFLNYNEIFENIDIEKANYIKVNVILLFDSLLITLFKFEPELDYTATIVNKPLLDTFQNYFKTNIIFIDTLDHSPFMLNNYNEELKSILILSHNNKKHFEIIGKLLEKNRIQREFTFNDSFFHRIHQMITEKK